VTVVRLKSSGIPSGNSEPTIPKLVREGASSYVC